MITLGPGNRIASRLASDASEMQLGRRFASPAAAGAWFRHGESVRVHGRSAVFVKRCGTLGAVVRFEDEPQEPRVVPFMRIDPA